MSVLAMQSVFEESLPRPSVDAIRGEMMPSCFVLQPIRRGGREATRIVYLLQVRFWDLDLFCARQMTRGRKLTNYLSKFEFLQYKKEGGYITGSL